MVSTLPIMMDEIAQAMIPSLRFAAMILWFMPILWAQPAYKRVILTGELSHHDWNRVAIGSIGVVFVGIQIRSFIMNGGDQNDYWTAMLLFLASLAAILSMAVVYWSAAPDENKRAMFRAHLAIFVLCMIGGFL